MRPRHFTTTVRIGEGAQHWDFASTEVLRWGVKTRSGFSVLGDPQVAAGQERVIVAHLGPLAIREPVTVVHVTDDPDRKGFTYATRPGHPVRGKETFEVSRSDDGSVHLTVRSTTAPAQGLWGLAFPLILVAQRVYRRRYLRALTG